MFTVIGILEGKAVSVTWSDGEITGGDTLACLLCEGRGTELIGTQVGLIPGGTTKDHFKDPTSALMIIDEVLDEIIEVEGDKPTTPGSDEILRSMGLDPAKHRPIVF